MAQLCSDIIKVPLHQQWQRMGNVAPHWMWGILDIWNFYYGLHGRPAQIQPMYLLFLSSAVTGKIKCIQKWANINKIHLRNTKTIWFWRSIFLNISKRCKRKLCPWNPESKPNCQVHQWLGTLKFCILWIVDNNFNVTEKIYCASFLLLSISVYRRWFQTTVS